MNELQDLVDKQFDAAKESGLIDSTVEKVVAKPQETPVPVEGEVPKAETPKDVIPDTDKPLDKKEETPIEDKPTNYTQEQVDGFKSEWETQYKESNPKVDLDERMTMLKDHFDRGGDLDEKFWKYQTVDFSGVKLDDVDNVIDLIENELIDVQGMSKQEASFIVKDSYPNLFKEIDKDIDEENQSYDRDFMRATIEAKKILPNLIKLQKDMKLPPKQEVVSNAPTQEQIDKYMGDASAALNSFSTFDVKVSDDVTLEIKTDEDSLKGVKELLMNPSKQNSYLPDRYVKDGTIDFDSLKRDTYILDNFEKIVKEIGLQNFNMGKEAIIKDQGTAPTLASAAPKGGKPLTPMEQYRANMHR